MRMKPRPDWYKGSFCAPDCAEYEPPRAPFDIEAHQIENFVAGGRQELFDFLEDEKMVAIVNIGPHDAMDTLGRWDYEVRVNRDVICTFSHVRKDGLATCLFLAAKAVKEIEEKT